jgi:hypothetical protein
MKAPCTRLFCSARFAKNWSPVPPDPRTPPMSSFFETTAMTVLAIVAQDHVALRAAPGTSATAHAQLWQGELLEVRGRHPGQLQVYDHRLERAGYIRENEARIVGTTQADAPQLLAVLRFLRDTPGAESLGIAYAAAYLKAAPAAAITAEPFDALGAMAERLARGATQRQGKVEAVSAHMDVATQYGIKFVSYESNGSSGSGNPVQLCYDGDAFRHVLAMDGSAGSAKATLEQRARASLALTRPECIDPALSPRERKAADQQRADLLDRIDADASAQLEQPLRNRLHLRRAGVYAAIAFDKSRFQEPAQPAAQRAVDELAAVDKTELAGDDTADYTEAALRVGAVRWAAAGTVTAPGRLQVELQPSEPGQTCVRLFDSWIKNQPTLAQRCTYGTVWAASARSMADGRALALTVQPLDGWSELWVWHQEPDGWKIDVLAPEADGPGLGYVEWAGWSPSSRRKVLVVREAKYNGHVTRRFEVRRTDTLVAEKSAADPQQLIAFALWADAGWRQETVSLR